MLVLSIDIGKFLNEIKFKPQSHFYDIYGVSIKINQKNFTVQKKGKKNETEDKLKIS